MLDDAQNLPTIDFRMVTSRLLVELCEFKNAVKVLDTIIQENDENPEAWYLLSFSYFNLKKYLNANECCKNVLIMIKKLKMTAEEELQAGYDELSKAIAKALGKKSVEEAQASDDEAMEEGEADDGFETLSEEDISGDEENGDAKMKD